MSPVAGVWQGSMMVLRREDQGGLSMSFPLRPWAALATWRPALKGAGVMQIMTELRGRSCGSLVGSGEVN